MTNAEVRRASVSDLPPNMIRSLCTSQGQNIRLTVIAEMSEGQLDALDERRDRLTKAQLKALDARRAALTPTMPKIESVPTMPVLERVGVGRAHRDV